MLQTTPFSILHVQLDKAAQLARECASSEASARYSVRDLMLLQLIFLDFVILWGPWPAPKGVGLSLTLFMDALRSRHLGEWEQAISLLEKAIRNEGDPYISTYLIRAKGRVFQEIGLYGKAELCLHAALMKAHQTGMDTTLFELDVIRCTIALGHVGNARNQLTRLEAACQSRFGLRKIRTMIGQCLSVEGLLNEAYNVLEKTFGSAGKGGVPDPDFYEVEGRVLLAHSCYRVSRNVEESLAWVDAAVKTHNTWFVHTYYATAHQVRLLLMTKDAHAGRTTDAELRKALNLVQRRLDDDPRGSHLVWSEIVETDGKVLNIIRGHAIAIGCGSLMEGLSWLIEQFLDGTNSPQNQSLSARASSRVLTLIGWSKAARSVHRDCSTHAKTQSLQFDPQLWRRR